MHLHILGIAGTFMSGLALLAREKGFDVTGSDAHCYPPVSDLLMDKGIELIEGYDSIDSMDAALSADKVIIGNAMKRGMPIVETVLNKNKTYTSGPAWLSEHILCDYRVMAVSGTHGKTTTTSMLAFILDRAGLMPGFLVGGVASNFNTNARLGNKPWFIIEADEYDSAFFDKRPKFMHYRPEVAILNNLEFDHADIYPDLKAIEQQFHYYLRTIPGKGLVIKPNDEALNRVIALGAYTKIEGLKITTHPNDSTAEWQGIIRDEAGSVFDVYYQGNLAGTVEWPLIGRFNIENAMAAIAAAHYAGVSPELAVNSIRDFIPVKRRLECVYQSDDLIIYDDFAHHPTAIKKTLEALKASQRHRRLVLVLEFGSFTMKHGDHFGLLPDALNTADVIVLCAQEGFLGDTVLQKINKPYHMLPTVDAVLSCVLATIQPGDGIVIMSNKGFDNLHQRLIASR